MDNNWIVENLTNAFGVWNSKMTEMWSLLTESPQTFKGGTIWQTIVTINGGMQAIGYGLLVLFFAIGIFRSASGFRDFQRPEHLLRHFIYFVLAKLGITYGMDLLVDVFDVCSGIVATAAGSVTYIHSLATTVKISDSGQAICQGRATLNAITNSASLTMKLQRSSNGSSWTTLKTWTATDTGTIFMEESWPVAPGYYYQTVVTAEAYTSSGSVAETVTASSAVVKY